MADSTKRTSRLGRGLSSLMSQPVAVTPPTPPTPSVPASVGTKGLSDPVADPPATGVVGQNQNQNQNQIWMRMFHVEHLPQARA